MVDYYSGYGFYSNKYSKFLTSVGNQDKPGGGQNECFFARLHRPPGIPF